MPSAIDIALGPVAQALDDLQVRYYVCGSVASSAHGEMRTTADIDVVAELHVEQASALAARLAGDYHADEVAIRDAIRRRSSFNVINYATFMKVDVFAPKGRAYDLEVLERRVPAKLGEADDAIMAPVCSPEDVVLAKLEWFRMGGESSERQWRDIQGVIKIQSFVLDFEYMEKWAREIGVGDLLERALQDAGVEEIGN